MNNAQLMRELKESEEIKQVINHLTQDIIDLYHIQIPIQDIDEAVKMFGGRVEEDREKYCKYCDFISKERDSFAIYISPYYKSERRKMIIAQQLGHLFLHMGYQTNHDLWNHQKRIKKFSDARWNSGERCWTIDESNLDAARVIMKEIYGYADNEINEKVTLKIHVKESVSKKHGDVILFGKILSHATGRDSGAHPGSDVAYIHGSAYSGGSAKNWESVVSEDSEILLHNVNKNLYEEYLENPQEEYEIEVVTDSIDSAALKQEKERLLKRIKEIDHVLNCEG